MKNLFVVYFKEGKNKKRAYFKAMNISILIFKVSRLFSLQDIVNIKKLKRIYRKTDFILEV